MAIIPKPETFAIVKNSSFVGLRDNFKTRMYDRIVGTIPSNPSLIEFALIFFVIESSDKYINSREMNKLLINNE